MDSNLQKSQSAVAIESAPAIKFTKGDALASIIIGLIIGIFVPMILKNVGKSLPFQELYFAIFPFLVLVGMRVVYLIAARIPVLLQIAKFGAIGASNTVIDFGILNFLSASSQVFSGLFLVPLNAISFSIAVLNSYFWNRYWTFKGGQKNAGKQFLEFIVVSVIAALINTVLVYLLTLIPPIGGISEPLWLNISKLFATFISLVWNFLGYKFLVFKE